MIKRRSSRLPCNCADIDLTCSSAQTSFCMRAGTSAAARPDASTRPGGPAPRSWRSSASLRVRTCVPAVRGGLGTAAHAAAPRQGHRCMGWQGAGAFNKAPVHGRWLRGCSDSTPGSSPAAAPMSVVSERSNTACTLPVPRAPPIPNSLSTWDFWHEYPPISYAIAPSTDGFVPPFDDLRHQGTYASKAAAPSPVTACAREAAQAGAAPSTDAGKAAVPPPSAAAACDAAQSAGTDAPVLVVASGSSTGSEAFSSLRSEAPRSEPVSASGTRCDPVIMADGFDSAGMWRTAARPQVNMPRAPAARASAQRGGRTNFRHACAQDQLQADLDHASPDLPACSPIIVRIRGGAQGDSRVPDSSRSEVPLSSAPHTGGTAAHTGGLAGAVPARGGVDGAVGSVSAGMHAGTSPAGERPARKQRAVRARAPARRYSPTWSAGNTPSTSASASQSHSGDDPDATECGSSSDVPGLTDPSGDEGEQENVSPCVPQARRKRTARMRADPRAPRRRSSPDAEHQQGTAGAPPHASTPTSAQQPGAAPGGGDAATQAACPHDGPAAGGAAPRVPASAGGQANAPAAGPAPPGNDDEAVYNNVSTGPFTDCVGDGDKRRVANLVKKIFAVVRSGTCLCSELASTAAQCFASVWFAAIPDLCLDMRQCALVIVSTLCRSCVCDVVASQAAEPIVSSSSSAAAMCQPCGVSVRLPSSVMFIACTCSPGLPIRGVSMYRWLRVMHHRSSLMWFPAVFHMACWPVTTPTSAHALTASCAPNARADMRSTGNRIRRHGGLTG